MSELRERLIWECIAKGIFEEWPNPGKRRTIGQTIDDMIDAAKSSLGEQGIALIQKEQGWRNADMFEAVSETAKTLSHKIGDFTHWEYVLSVRDLEKVLRDSPLYALQKEQGWRDIESAPQNTPVLVWAACEGWPGKFARVCAYLDGIGVWRVYGPIMGEPSPKHKTAQAWGEVEAFKWQPLPTPPQGEDG